MKTGDINTYILYLSDSSTNNKLQSDIKIQKCNTNGVIKYRVWRDCDKPLTFCPVALKELRDMINEILE